MPFFLASFNLDTQLPAEVTSDSLHLPCYTACPTPAFPAFFCKPAFHNLPTPAWSHPAIPGGQPQLKPPFPQSDYCPQDPLGSPGQDCCPSKINSCPREVGSSPNHHCVRSSYSQASHLAMPGGGVGARGAGPTHQCICSSCDQLLHTARLRADSTTSTDPVTAVGLLSLATWEISPAHKSASSSRGSCSTGRHNRNATHTGDVTPFLVLVTGGYFTTNHCRVPSP